MLGLSDLTPKFVRQYAQTGKDIQTAVRQYASDVRNGNFPAQEQVYFPLDK